MLKYLLSSNKIIIIVEVTKIKEKLVKKITFKSDKNE